jgi:hypothetical protein
MPGKHIAAVSGEGWQSGSLSVSEKPLFLSAVKPVSGFENVMVLNTLINLRRFIMSAKIDLVGKTISGIIAVQDSETDPVGIWMMQFTDGTHVEFVSPAARRRLRRVSRANGRRSQKRVPEAQLALNVA